MMRGRAKGIRWRRWAGTLAFGMGLVVAGQGASAAVQSLEVASRGCTVRYTPVSIEPVSGHIQVLVTRTCGRFQESHVRSYEAAGAERGKPIEHVDLRALYSVEGGARDPYFRPYLDRAWSIILSLQGRSTGAVGEVPEPLRAALIHHGLIVTNTISLETDAGELGDAYVLSFPVDEVGRFELLMSIDSDAYRWDGPFIE